MSVLLSPAGIAVTAIIGVVIVIANLIDVLTPDKEEKGAIYAGLHKELSKMETLEPEESEGLE